MSRVKSMIILKDTRSGYCTECIVCDTSVQRNWNEVQVNGKSEFPRIWYAFISICGLWRLCFVCRDSFRFSEKFIWIFDDKEAVVSFAWYNRLNLIKTTRFGVACQKKGPSTWSQPVSIFCFSVLFVCVSNESSQNRTILNSQNCFAALFFQSIMIWWWWYTKWFNRRMYRLLVYFLLWFIFCYENCEQLFAQILWI